jgi:hypothetical protein
VPTPIYGQPQGVYPYKTNWFKDIENIRCSKLVYHYPVYSSLVKSDRLSAAELEREIDEIVYKLYGLTEEEIKIIQDNVKQK